MSGFIHRLFGSSASHASSTSNHTLSAEAVDKELYKAKLKGLPSAALKVFRESKLERDEIWPLHWELFLICLQHCCKDLTVEHLSSGSAILVDKNSKEHREQLNMKFVGSSQTSADDQIGEAEPPSNSSMREVAHVTPRKLYTNEEIDQLLTKGNPKSFYTDFQKLGRGGFAKVDSAICVADRTMVAVKWIEKQFDKYADKIMSEVEVLTICAHPNIIQHRASYCHKNRIAIVTEYCDGGSLRQLVQLRLKEEHIVFILYEILQGLSYLHSLGYIHRDIKSANIFLTTSGCVKIGDLGLCATGIRQGLAGSKYWCAPEMIARKTYNTQADIWSLGALAYEMAEGVPPYREFRSLKAIFLIASQGAPPLRKPKTWSPEFRDFLQQCFTMDPTIRPNAAALLQHPLFNRIETRQAFAEVLSTYMVAKILSGY